MKHMSTSWALQDNIRRVSQEKNEYKKCVENNKKQHIE